jgi:pimeloyl-ACP methyl ester carboxylesterase
MEERSFVLVSRVTERFLWDNLIVNERSFCSISERMKPSTALLDVGGVSLHIEEAGQGSAVVAVHGLGSSGRDWGAVTPLVAARHRIIVPDLRGHGRSQRPPGRYDVPRFAADVAAVCDRMAVEKAHVVGLSLGGMIAFELALARPDLVHSMVIVNSGPDMVPRTPRFALALAQRIAVTTLLGPRGMARILGPRLFPRPDQSALREQFQSSLSASDPIAYRRSTLGIMGWSVLHRLHEIACPVLVVASDRDYTPVAFKQAYVDKLRDARLHELPDSGHLASLDQPARLAELVLGFLAEVDGRDSPRVTRADAAKRL